MDPYDQNPYPSYSYHVTHPDVMYLHAKLFGMEDPPDFRTARVLELGCASGGNLIPYAIAFPESECIGIDLSKKQIEMGRREIRDLELKNIELLATSITEYTNEKPFDYIICHGVLSWVNAEVRNATLELVRRLLQPKGVAVISYNANPGWMHLQPMIDLLRHRFGTDLQTVPMEEIDSCLKLMTDSSQNHLTELAIKLEMKTQKSNEGYFRHDHLEANNHAFYLTEFADMLGSHGLQFMSDSYAPIVRYDRLTEDMKKTIENETDYVRKHQYRDFFINKRFRCDTVIHSDVSIQKEINPSFLMDCYIVPNLRRVDPATDYGFPKGTFLGNADSEVHALSHLQVSLLVNLSDVCYHSVKIGTVIEKVISEMRKMELDLGADPERRMMETILQLVINKHAVVFPEALSIKADVEGMLAVSPFTRYQVAVLGRNWTVSQTRQTVFLDEGVTRLIPLLDGRMNLTQVLKYSLHSFFGKDLEKTKKEVTRVMTVLISKHLLVN